MCANRQCGIMKIGRAECFFQEFNIAQAYPGRYKQVKLCRRHPVQVFQPRVFAKDEVGSQSQFAYERGKFTEIAQPVRVMRRNGAPNIHQPLNLFTLRQFGQILFDDGIYHPLVPLVVGSLKAGGVHKYDRFFRLLKLAYHLFDVIADNFGGTTGKHHVEIAIHHFQRVFNDILQFALASKNDLRFADV
ncbi:hypothetical protein Barb6_02850 [Bacteroidales bacterium Barb6]|nr:hypothetical protein Barb6_02850 [Bacteroidales bacterium Barb6]